MPIKKSALEQKWYYRVAKVFFVILPLLVAAIFLNGKINILGISQKNILDILQKNIVYIIYVAIGLVLYFLILNVVWKLFLYIVFGGLEDDTKKEGGEATQSVSPAVQPAQAKPAEQLIPIIIIIVILAIFVLSEMGYITLPKIDLNFEHWNPIESHTYGAPCKASGGKTGLYGTNGNCYTCSEGTAVTNPINNNCSNGIAGVYCCGTANDGDTNNDGCISTGCGSLWYCSGSYYIGGQEITVPGLCFPRPAGEIYPSWRGICRQCP